MSSSEHGILESNAEFANWKSPSSEGADSRRPALSIDEEKHRGAVLELDEIDNVDKEQASFPETGGKKDPITETNQEINEIPKELEAVIYKLRSKLLRDTLKPEELGPALMARKLVLKHKVEIDESLSVGRCVGPIDGLVKKMFEAGTNFNSLNLDKDQREQLLEVLGEWQRDLYGRGQDPRPYARAREDLGASMGEKWWSAMEKKFGI